MPIGSEAVRLMRVGEKQANLAFGAVLGVSGLTLAGFVASLLGVSSADSLAQALGSALGAIATGGAVLGAFWVARYQADRQAAEQAAARASEHVAHARRLVAGLQSEIRAAVTQAGILEFTINRTLTAVEEARRQGKEIRQAPLGAEAVLITDAIVFKAVAEELGRLPPNLIRKIVSFYGGARGIQWIGEIGDSPINTMKTILPLLSRARILGLIAVTALDKFERSDFDAEANVEPGRNELFAMARDVGYPIDEVLKEHGPK